MTTLIAGCRIYLPRESYYSNSRLKTRKCLKGTHPQAVAFDTQNTTVHTVEHLEMVYLWKSDDGRRLVIVAKTAFSGSDVMPVSVSHVEDGDRGFNKVYVETEPARF
jgi:hypothetical protein